MKTKTEKLMKELTLRMSDWFEDPEPQYDECFAKCNQYHLESAYNILRNLNRQKPQDYTCDNRK